MVVMVLVTWMMMAKMIVRWLTNLNILQNSYLKKILTDLTCMKSSNSLKIQAPIIAMRAILAG